jgi:hypothetical protein
LAFSQVKVTSRDDRVLPSPGAIGVGVPGLMFASKNSMAPSMSSLNSPALQDNIIKEAILIRATLDMIESLTFFLILIPYLNKVMYSNGK